MDVSVNFQRGIYVILVGIICIYSIYQIERNTLKSRMYETKQMAKQYKKIGERNTASNSRWKGLLNCQEVRLKRLQDKCEKYDLIPNRSLHELPEKDLQNLFGKFLTDDIHNVILKAIPKTGCTSWKTLLLNNTMHYLSWVKQMPWVHSWGGMKRQTGVYTLQDFNKQAILLRLKKYLMIVTVRHPLARLESAFRDKRTKLTQADVETHVEDLQVKFLNFVEERLKNSGNRHWKTYMSHANPCIIPYNFIAKTETANAEMRYIVEEKLSNIGGPIQKNPSFSLKADKKLNNTDRLLPFFSKLKNPEQKIQKLMTIYGKDMELFGYTWEIRKDGVYATCESYEFDGMCC